MTRGDADDKRTRDVRIRLTESEWQVWDAARAASGRREMGAWARAFIHEALLRRVEGRRPGDLPRVVVPETNRDAVEQLRRVGNNLNQLTRAANIDGHVDVDELRRLLVQLDDALRIVRGQRPPRVVAPRTGLGDPPPAEAVDEHQAVTEPVGVGEHQVVPQQRRRRWFGGVRS